MNNLIKSRDQIFESFSKSVANVILYYQGDEREALLNRLRGEVEKLCEMEEKWNIALEISKHVSASYDPEAGAEDNRQNHFEEYKSQISNITPNPSNYKNLKEFDRIVSALKAASDGPQASDAEGDDCDLQLTRDTINLIDPVTKKRMTDPVRNTICSHIYDRESVVELLKINPLTRCPVPGCKYEEPLSIENMKTDIVTKTYLDKHSA